MSIDSAIESLVSRQLKTDVKIAPPPQLKGTVVTVARGCGSGGEAIASALAERLKLRFYDVNLLDAIAEEARTHKPLMKALDEHSEHLMNGWLRSIITGKGAFQPEYRRALVNVVLGISHSGGVIVGRGANFILSGKNVFRLRVVCPLPICAERIAKEENLSLEKAEKHVLKTDEKRDNFLKKVYPGNIHASASYDLTISTGSYNQEQALELILCAMRLRGFEVPEPQLATST